MGVILPNGAAPLPPVAGSTPAVLQPDVLELPDFISSYVDPLRILLIGLTGTGKTTLIGEVAEFLFAKRHEHTLLYNMDRGTPESIKNYIDPEIGVIRPVTLGDVPDDDPFIFASKASKGLYRAPGTKEWIDPPFNVGLYAFDSATGIGEEALKAIRDSQATQSPIGPKAYSFSIGHGEDKLTIGTTDKSHYGIVQGRIVDTIWESGDNIKKPIIYTAGLRRNDQDDETKLPQLGPDLAGKALIGVAPKWVKYTWCLTKGGGSGNQPNVHVLHLDAYNDGMLGGVQVVGNARVPLRGGNEVVVPTMIQPASLVRALHILASRQAAAKADIKKRLGIA